MTQRLKTQYIQNIIPKLIEKLKAFKAANA